MKENLLDFFLSEWAKNFYTEPLLNISQVALLITFRNNKLKNKILDPFKYYAFAGVFLFLTYNLLHFFITNKFIKRLLFEFSNGAFTFIELFVFGAFYSHYIKSKKINQLIPIFIILVITIYSAFLLYISFNHQPTSEINTHINKLIFIELIFWGLLSVQFYFELFKFYTNENLLHNPAFWIISFSLLYTLILPSYFLILEIYRIEDLFLFNILVSIHYLSLLLVYLGIIKALKCNTPLNR